MVLKAWQALLLGLVQGFTEFLPVSSSGHLVIAQSLLGIKAEMLSFDIFVHVGTLVAVFVYFWSDIRELLKRPFCRFTALLLVGCIPAGLMGVLLDELFEHLFSSLAAVACALIVTGVLLYVWPSRPVCPVPAPLFSELCCAAWNAPRPPASPSCSPSR